MNWKRYLPAFVLIILVGIVYFFDLGDYFTMEQIKKHRILLKTLVRQYPILAPLTYMVSYVLATAVSIPGAIFLTTLGGFLFPQPFATIFVVISATVGSLIPFLVAKTVLGNSLEKRMGGVIRKMQKGFQENAISYLLFLRLIPIFPFWVVNLAPAFFGISLFTFFWTTLIGIIPGSFVFVQAGAGLGAIFDAGDTLSLDTIFNRDVKIALVALGIFALLPIIVKKARHHDR